MSKYQKKPVVIEAFQFTPCGHPGETFAEFPVVEDERGLHLSIPTLEGPMRADPGDWIITGVKGEKYPCKPDIFTMTYQPVVESGISEEQRARLLAETQETASRLNKLNAFMATDAFPKLDRDDKDLLYSQQRVMSEYVQILGKRLERAGTKFAHTKQIVG